MKNALRNKFITILAILLSVCMLFGAASFYMTTAKAENTTSIAQVVEGASVRVTSAESSGIKFRARLDKTEYNSLYSTYEGKVKAGMIIVPSDYIAKAGGYAFSDFAAANLTVGANTIDEFDGSNEDYFEFTMSLVNLKDANYARDFEAIVFIEVDTTDAISGFETYNGKQYAYGVRDAACARNIYEVANSTFNDRVNAEDTNHPYLVNGKYMSVDENGLAIVKGYVDGVADIKIAGGAPAVANNTEYYTSSYTFSKNAITGDYILNGSPKSLIVDGERQVDMHVEKGSVEIHTAKTLNATVALDGTITTAGKGLQSSGQGFTLVEDAKLSDGKTETGIANNYYAFDGKYGVGTAIDIYFTGNNMPEIMLFSNDVTPNMSGYSKYDGSVSTSGVVDENARGFLISNGFVAGANSAVGKFAIWGPNKFYFNGALSGTYNSIVATSKANGGPIAYATSAGQGKLFTNEYIANNFASADFKLIVSTYETANETLGIKLELFQKIDGVYSTFDTSSLGNSVWREKSYDTGVLVSEVNPGAIILYDSVKGAGNDTVFTCSTPYGGDLVSNGTVAVDGTVTLNAVGASSNTASSIASLSVPYLAFEGNYGIGTFVDFEFTGNNLPQVMFFADSINGNVYNNGAGLFITNGILTTQDRSGESSFTNHYYHTTNGDAMLVGDRLAFFGPNKINANILTLSLSKITIAQDSLLTYKGLEADTTGRTYIYKVGTLLDTDNTIIIHTELTDKATGALITSATKDTGISNTELSSGNIIAYGQIKGAGNTTTFKAGKPYQGGASYGMSEATIAADGTVTLAGKSLKSSAQPFGIIPEAYTSTGDATGNVTSYFALAGEYGIGTYMDFYFTGNNMPEVMFFADKINGNLSGYSYYKGNTANSAGTLNGGEPTGEKGVVISNGLYGGNTGNDIAHMFSVWGPNRIYFGDNVALTNAFKSSGYMNHAAIKFDNTDANYSLLTQEVLGSGAYDSTNFKYTVGTYELDGELCIHIILYTVSGETTTKVLEYMNTTGIATSEIEAGNIVICDTYKGSDTVFKYSAPYESAPSVFSKGATVAEDGTITLTGTSTGLRMYDLANLDNNYYALNGKYGVGTSVEVFFTGNNMPEIMLFADAINGNMTGYSSYASGDNYSNYTLSGQKGLLFSNGFMSGAGANQAPDMYVIWGMDRAVATTGLSAGYRDVTASALVRYVKTTAEALALCQNTLASTYADTPLKYTVGTYDNNGKLAITVVLENLTTSETIMSIDTTTKIDTVNVAPGSIIFYDTVKGSDTVFKIGEVGK